MDHSKKQWNSHCLGKGLNYEPYNETMKRDEVLAILRREKSRLQALYGLKALGVFGSVARDEAGITSDTDIVVDVPIINAWSYLQMRQDLEQSVGGKVDIVRLRPGLRESLRKRIEAEAIFV